MKRSGSGAETCRSLIFKFTERKIYLMHTVLNSFKTFIYWHNCLHRALVYWLLNTCCVIHLWETVDFAYIFTLPQTTWVKINSADVVPLCFRECIECRLFNSGRLADNQTCQRLCKDEIITLETLSKLTNKCTCYTLTGCHWLYVLTAQLGAHVCSFESLLTYDYRATEQLVSPVSSSFQFRHGREWAWHSQLLTVRGG